MMNIDIQDNKNEDQRLYQSSDGFKHALINKNLVITFLRAKNKDKTSKNVTLPKLKHKYQIHHTQKLVYIVNFALGFVLLLFNFR